MFMNQTRSMQSPSSVVMVRPAHFRPNPQTATDNSFQRSNEALDFQQTAAAASIEAQHAADALAAHGVRVHLFDEVPHQDTPDAVFPNNWFSTHPDGKVAIFPMYAANRRRERRSDIIDMLKRNYHVEEVIDLSGMEHDDLFLEGTGAMVLDHVQRVAYAARSNRIDARALEKFCLRFDYEPLLFTAVDAQERPVYHTNVIMALASDFALLGVEHISDPATLARLRTKLETSGREVIELSAHEVAEFAGNALEFSTPTGNILAISARGVASLSSSKRRRIERYAAVVALAVPTIELAGGSVRCMLAGIHLTPRSNLSWDNDHHTHHADDTSFVT